ncbi:MAG TPA: hypothetical protein VGC57_09540 [Cellulomonas sp.]
MTHRLTLVPGTGTRHESFFWEPMVDGTPLRRLIALDEDDRRLDTADLGPVGENVPVLVHSWPTGLARRHVDPLLGTGPSELPGGRVPLYVCPVCADLGCGAVSALVERTATSVVWRDFGWDVWSVPEDGDEIRFDGGPFVFDRAQHDAEITRFVDTFDAVRATLVLRPPPPLRRRRWFGLI